ncbi:MAG: hypothetical protein O9322_09410 [Beijerinckiaceae bacterium]|nr:hypothetical protein [Beijerinckiaceae bacterium]MCZ8299549.1 hypothetical protein [Beijerinckiaceae bacterium]
MPQYVKWVPFRRALASAILLALAPICLLTSGGAARATAFCEVKATRDGFVALRDAPSTRGKLIRRLEAGEMVQLDSTRPNPRGWKAVIFRAGEGGKDQPGWVSAGLIERECG